jgi:hypothetical protein
VPAKSPVWGIEDNHPVLKEPKGQTRQKQSLKENVIPALETIPRTEAASFTKELSPTKLNPLRDLCDLRAMLSRLRPVFAHKLPCLPKYVGNPFSSTLY